MKKRKLQVFDADAERTLNERFVSAANSISQLYAQAVGQQRKSSAAASRQALERIAQFLMRDFPTTESIPKDALLFFLNQEYEAIEGCENAPHQFPVQLFPTAPQGAAVSPASQQDPVAADSQARGRCPHMGTLQSPARRSAHGAGAGAMDTMEQQHLDMDPATQSNNQQHPGYGYNF